MFATNRFRVWRIIQCYQKKVSQEFIQGLPKSELHVHIEGTLDPKLKLKLAQRNNVDIGQETVEDIEETYHYYSLASFLAV